jgi:hypothetical protein
LGTPQEIGVREPPQQQEQREVKTRRERREEEGRREEYTMTHTTIDRPPVREPSRENGHSQSSEPIATTRVISGGSFVEAIAGLGAVVLAVLGLAGVVPEQLAAIAVIAIGGGFLLRGAAVAARMTALMDRSGHQEQVASGLSAELLAGVAGVALGVLSLVGVEIAVLLPVALIAFGAAMMVGAAMTRELDTKLGGVANMAALDTDLGAEVLVGLGAVVLGIIALASTPFNITLILAGVAAVGAGMTLEALPGLVRLFGVGR